MCFIYIYAKCVYLYKTAYIINVEDLYINDLLYILYI